VCCCLNLGLYCLPLCLPVCREVCEVGSSTDSAGSIRAGGGRLTLSKPLLGPEGFEGVLFVWGSVSIAAVLHSLPAGASWAQCSWGGARLGRKDLSGYVHSTAHVPGTLLRAAGLAAHTVAGRGCWFTPLVCVDVFVGRAVLCCVGARLAHAQHGDLAAALCPVSGFLCGLAA
jgi:hypothetical protein